MALLAAWAGSEEPIAVAAVLPLAILIAVFSRERRGRIENAQALQRLTENSRDRLQSIVQNSSDVIIIAAPDGALRNVYGSVAAIFGADSDGGSLYERVHPDDLASVASFLAL